MHRRRRCMASGAVVDRGVFGQVPSCDRRPWASQRLLPRSPFGSTRALHKYRRLHCNRPQHRSITCPPTFARPPPPHPPSRALRPVAAAMPPANLPPPVDSPSFGFLSPPIDAGDVSSDDGDTLQTPLTQHDDHKHHPFSVFHHHHQFSHELLPLYAPQPHKHTLLGNVKPDRDSRPLSPLASLSSLLAPSLSEPIQSMHQDTFFSAFSSPPHALDLANVSLDIAHFVPGYNNHVLDPNASPFTPIKQSFDNYPNLLTSSPGPSTSSPLSGELPPLPALPVECLNPAAVDDSPSLLLSSCLPKLSRAAESENDLIMKGRMYSPRFPADHTLNPFFVRTYALGDELGAGGYGFVMTARHRGEGYEVAVKFIIKDKVPDHAWWEDEAFGRIPTEVMLITLVDHENVVKCLDLFEDEVYFYMVQELHGTPWVSKKKKKEKQVTAPGKLVVPSPSSTPSLTPSPSFESTAESTLNTPPQVCIENVDASLSSSQQQAPAGHDPAGSLVISPHNPPGALPDMDAKELPPAQSPCVARLQMQMRPNFSRRASHDLFECIEQSKHKRLSENQARYVFAQVVEAVYYLDSQGITHCDIKDENLLVDSDLKVKLIDFGSAVVADPAAPRPYYTLFFGTTAYASSEILRKQPYRAPPAEVWTLGVLLAYLLTGHSPFPTEQDALDGRIVLREPGRGGGRLSRAAVALMGRCLERDPERRADIVEVRGHRWLQGALERGARE
ncbi:hypothetical protein AcV7_004268 [Taiwanofungus camphoratus]|nr:hypothetical protein AcV7_004268 [Antrodia cinnamomea]